ncbi:5,6-dimethylbenzimidazole synthase [Rhizobium sp. DKSPLA3]|uniref:5,6-dimethylbenzimidazole synthase n=1 Tax=Rhizobium quercicola TaxID=2901226 RepID=A0A9X1T5S4_9HYPH|nr:5,6-dimethylbenzimidazole synthase [Rhizobium quercicola]MCD7108028.1 5,6-dimethylbenzimidazole synthase [Rhizobium quercicola]
MPPKKTFDAAFRAELTQLLTWRRDVRQFRTDPLPAGTIERLVQAAGLAPSVGLSQPWRFVFVEDAGRRATVRQVFEACNATALAGYSGERAERYARLKLAGLDAAPCQFAVFCDRSVLQGHGLGRATMPETLDYSVVLAVHTLWLAARAEGLGLGWLSILDPAEVVAALAVPESWHFIGYFCLGYPTAEDDTPALERAGWEQRGDPGSVIVRR